MSVCWEPSWRSRMSRHCRHAVSASSSLPAALSTPPRFNHVVATSKLFSPSTRCLQQTTHTAIHMTCATRRQNGLSTCCLCPGFWLMPCTSACIIDKPLCGTNWGRQSSTQPVQAPCLYERACRVAAEATSSLQPGFISCTGSTMPLAASHFIMTASQVMKTGAYITAYSTTQILALPSPDASRKCT